MSKDLKGNVKKTPAASIDSLPSCDSEDVSDIELPILELDIGKGRDEACIIDSDEDDIFKGFEYGEDETDVSVIDSGEKGKKQTLSISDNDEDEDQEDYTKYSWFWEDGQRLTDSQYRIENDEELTTATTAAVDVDAAAATTAAAAAAAAATATNAAAAAAAAATATGACSDATNVENYGDMFDTEIDSLMSRADIDLIQFMDNYIIENGIIEDHYDVLFNINVHNPVDTDDDDDDDDIENDSADDDDDNMENDDLETDTHKTNMDDDDDDELISMVQYEY